MSGIQQMLFVGAGGVPPTLAVINVNSIGSGVTAGVTFQADGSMTYIQTGGSTSGPTAWFTPPGGTPPPYWIRCNVSVGSLTSNPAVGFVQLNVGRSFTKVAIGLAAATASGTFQIASDAGGVTIVSTGNWTLSVN